MKALISNKKLTLILALIYFTSYVTRLNLTAVVAEVISSTGYSKSSFSIVLVFLSITYGVGQIVNGIIGDKIKPQLIILCGLITTTIVNFVFPFSTTILFMTILWAINGFAQAMMWPPMVRIMVNTLDEETYNKTVIGVINGGHIGTLFIYIFSPIIILLSSWKFVFITSSIIGVGAIILWLLTYNKIIVDDIQTKESKSFVFPSTALFPVIFIFLTVILQGMLRDGITTWMPSYLIEVFDFSEEISIFFTVSLAIISILSTVVFGYIYRKFIKNEILLAFIIFLVALLLNIVFYFTYNFNIVFSIIMITLIVGCIHGVNLCLISFVPKRFKKYGNISTISGITNSFTYVGAAISTYGVANLVENNGWSFTIGIWALIALIGVVSIFISYKPWKDFIKK